MTKLVCISDIHGMWDKFNIPHGDILIISGDICQNFSYYKEKDARIQLAYVEKELHSILDKLSNRFKYIILVPGNHDKCFALHEDVCRNILRTIDNLYILIDQQIKLNSIKFYGSPWTPWFHGDTWVYNIMPDYTKNNNIISQAKRIWEKIPNDTEVLITHGPPYGILDNIDYGNGQSVGCTYLLDRVKKINPKYHIFGHIHECYGRTKINTTEFINASICTLTYRPINKPIVISV